MESELFGIFRVKLVTKNIARGSPGTQFMHMRVKSLEKNLQRVLLVNIQTPTLYTGTKLSSQPRNVKDPIPLEEQHDIVYHALCSVENSNENYIGESTRRLDERMKDHNG